MAAGQAPKNGESKENKAEDKKKRANKLTSARIKKEIEFLQKMFAGIDDDNKKPS